MRLVVFLLLLLSFSYGESGVYAQIKNRLLEQGVDAQYLTKLFASEKMEQVNSVTLKHLIEPASVAKNSKRERRSNQNLIKKEELAKLKRHLREHKALYERIEREFGVEKEVIAAILQKETRLGSYPLKHDAVVVFNTILQNYGKGGSKKRQAWLKNLAADGFVDMVVWAYESGIDLSSATIASSYAGAIGIPQFMPFNLKYAKDASGKSVDINTLEGAITACANFLQNNCSYKPYGKLQNLQLAPLKEAYYTKGRLKLDDKKSSALFASLRCYNNSNAYVLGVLEIAQALER